MTDKIVVYPVIITHLAHETPSYLVEIPVLDGLTQGVDLADAIKMAEDYIGTYSLDNDVLPESVTISPSHKSNQIVSFVRVNIDEYRRRNDQKVIKKTLSIPNYLNELGNQNKVNFSSILTSALKKELGITE